MAQLAIEGLNRFALFGCECGIHQIVSANVGGVPIEFHVVLPMAAGGDVGVQAGTARSDVPQQMPADDVGILLISFESEYPGCVKELSLIGARLNRLEL